MKIPILVTTLAGLLISSLILGGYVVGVNNTASTLKVSYESKIKSNQGEFDNMWKKIQQTAQIPEQKKEAFRQIFNEYATARNSGGENQIMTWVTESVPDVNLNSYDDLMNIIVSSRNSWTMKQTELVGISEEYNKMLVVFPSGLVMRMFGHTRIDPLVITSEKTQEAFGQGLDNDIKLFDNK